MTVTVTNKTMNKTHISVFAPKHGSSNFDACTSVNQAATSECLKQKFVLGCCPAFHAMVDASVVSQGWIESLRVVDSKFKSFIVGLTLGVVPVVGRNGRTAFLKKQEPVACARCISAGSLLLETC